MAYIFENCILDTGRRELRRAGEIVPVGPQAFDLLAFLIDNRERVVSQDDLLATIWKGRVVSESTLRSQINAARAAIGDNGDAQRLIRTMPRKGFRFVGDVRLGGMAPVVPAHAVAASAIGSATRPASELDAEVPVPPVLRLPLTRTVSIALVGLTGAVLAGLFGLAMLRGAPVGSSLAPAERAQSFDAAVIPLLTDTYRTDVAGYPGLPTPKALAISVRGFGFAFGASDPDSAKKEALERCNERSQSLNLCRLYAADMDVVWPKEALPLPLRADVHDTMLDEPLIVDAVPLIGSQSRRSLVDNYVQGLEHKAVALKNGQVYWNVNTRGRAEAARLVIERCAHHYQAVCLLLSVDGMLTLRIPKTRRILDTFMLTTTTEMSEQEKERIGQIYQGPEWRALARGGSGGWYPIANAASERDAIEGALASCARQDRDCRIHAIGNFRVADES